jgi:hypothetical protein
MNHKSKIPVTNNYEEFSLGGVVELGFCFFVCVISVATPNFVGSSTCFRRIRASIFSFLNF